MLTSNVYAILWWSHTEKEKPSDVPRSLTRRSMTPLVLPFLLVFSTTAASNYDYFHLVLQVSLIFFSILLFFSILIIWFETSSGLDHFATSTVAVLWVRGIRKKILPSMAFGPLSAMECFHLVIRTCHHLLSTSNIRYIRLWHRLLYRKGTLQNESVSHSSFFILVFDYRWTLWYARWFNTGTVFVVPAAMATRSGNTNGISTAHVPCPGLINLLTSQQPSTSRIKLIFSLR